MSAGGTTKTKRIASPKMRHVRALSPYSRWQAQGEMGLQDQKSSFLSKYAGSNVGQMGGGPQGNIVNLGGPMAGQDASKDKADLFKQKLDMIRNMKGGAAGAQ